jgi:hypothetical protein
MLLLRGTLAARFCPQLLTPESSPVDSPATRAV